MANISVASGNELLPRDEFVASGTSAGYGIFTHTSGANLMPRSSFVASGNALLASEHTNIVATTSGIQTLGSRAIPFGSGHFTTVHASGLNRIPNAQPTTTSGGFIGTSYCTWDNVYCVSGVLPYGVRLAAPNGSGWRLHIDNAGNLTTTGPLLQSQFTPSDIPNMIGWWDASDTGTLFKDSAGTTSGVSASGDRVGHWKDKSGQTNDLQQETAARKGYYMTAIQNGLPAVAFSGAGGLVMNKNWDWPISGALNWTMMGIMKSTTGNTVLQYGLSSTASGCIRFTCASPALLFKSIDPVNSQQINTTTISQSNPFMFIVQRDSLDVLHVRVSGVSFGGPSKGSVLSGRIAPQSPNNRWELAAVSSGSSSRSTANYHELCAWAYSLSESEISAMSGYFRNKWGVAS